MQFKWVPTTYAFIRKVKKKYTGCNLKTKEFLDCALVGVCVVIRSNTVFRICLELAVSRKGWVRLDVKENKQVVPKIACLAKSGQKKNHQVYPVQMVICWFPEYCGYLSWIFSWRFNSFLPPHSPPPHSLNICTPLLLPCWII